jgi:hypothetical protein
VESYSFRLPLLVVEFRQDTLSNPQAATLFAAEARTDSFV